MKKDAISPAAPYLIIPIGILAVSTASLFIRFAQEYASSITIAAFRLGLAALILLPYTLIKYGRELRSLTPADLKFALLAGLILAVHFASWITSLEFTSVASSVVLVTTTPLWVSLLAPIFLGEKTPRIAFLGMGIALLGGVIIAGTDVCAWQSSGLQCQFAPGSSAAETLLGDFLALLGAIAAASYLMIGRHLRRKVSLTPYVFLVYSAAAIFLVIAMLIVDGVPPSYPNQVYLWLALLAIFPQLLGHSIFNWSLKYLPTGYVAVNLLGEPVGSIILANFFLDEVPSVVKIIGAILILAGIALASFQGNSQESRPILKEHLQ
ncbi:MAG TPA: EamA/RhaT family transporter [Chloroflexi bacterium]|nr:MAG: EamA/RhaT family transporter [Chloroflexota bacterium]HDD55804.1 EamA/RhaT family transporter [Chloroflexota bacterium]